MTPPLPALPTRTILSPQTAGSENTHAHDDGRKDDKSPRRVPEPASLLSYWTLYRYCRPLDWFLVIVGTLGAMAGGASMPVFTIILGRVINTFGQATSTHELVKELYSLIIWFVILAVVAAVTNGIEIYCWMVLVRLRAIALATVRNWNLPRAAAADAAHRPDCACCTRHRHCHHSHCHSHPSPRVYHFRASARATSSARSTSRP